MKPRATLLALILTTITLAACGDEGYTDIGVAEAKRLIETQPEMLVIDVSPYYTDGHIPGAKSYPLGDGSLDRAIPALDQSKPVLVYCHEDDPAIAGAQKLVDAGFQTVYRLEGNFQAWKNAGYPVEKKVTRSYADVDAAQAKALIDKTPGLVVIDVSPSYADGHIPGAVNYPMGDGSFDKALPKLDKSKAYLVYCHADGPAISGAQKLIDAGFFPVYRLKGNFQAWVKAGYPVQP